jgi:hypothetical protein
LSNHGGYRNLSSGSRGSAQAIFSDGTSVYAAGFVASPQIFPPGVTSVATSWQDGLAKQLTDVSTSAQAFGIAVGGPKASTYVVGTNFNDIGQIGTYWQNGVPRTLPETGVLYGIALLGNDVYITGFANGTAAYWKNGVIKKLANGTPSGIQVVAARKPVPVANL